MTSQKKQTQSYLSKSVKVFNTLSRATLGYLKEPGSF